MYEKRSGRLLLCMTITEHRIKIAPPRPRRKERITPIFASQPVDPALAARTALEEALRTHEQSAADALAEMHRHDAERRRAALALEADLWPVRIDEQQRAALRDDYARAAAATATARARHEQAIALVHATRVVLDTAL